MNLSSTHWDVRETLQVSFAAAQNRADSPSPKPVAQVSQSVSTAKVISMAVKELKPQHGFTLIEIIAGIVVVGIITLVVTAGMGPLYKQSVNPWQQVRAAGWVKA